jgi:hypothetical protein
MTIDGLLQFVGFAAAITLITLILKKRAYKVFPVFCAYLVWDFVDNLALYFVNRYYSGLYLRSYLVALTIDSIFMFGVLVELAWSVLRPFRSALPRGAIVVVALAVGLLGAVVWPFAHSAAYAQYGPQSRLLLHLQQTVAIVRILFFLVLAGCSQLLSISWRDRELQIATGLGIYSLVSFIACILQAGLPVGPFYALLDRIVICSMVCAYLYWIYSFAQKVGPRREFTPQMQSLLLAVAGAARSTRASLIGSGTVRSRERDR